MMLSKDKKYDINREINVRPKELFRNYDNYSSNKHFNKNKQQTKNNKTQDKEILLCKKALEHRRGT